MLSLRQLFSARRSDTWNPRRSLRRMYPSARLPTRWRVNLLQDAFAEVTMNTEPSAPPTTGNQSVAAPRDEFVGTSSRQAVMEQARQDLVAHGLRMDARLVCVQHSPFFHGLSLHECMEASSFALGRYFLRKQTLFRVGEPVRSVSLLFSGRVKVTQLSPSGAEVILRVHGPGDIAGEFGRSAGGVHAVTVQALEACQALVWEVTAFEALIKRFSVLQHNAMRILTDRLRDVEERFLDVATEQVAARLARLLIRLSSQMGQPVGGVVHIGLSREELAQMIGTTLFTVSRLLSQWEALDIVHTGREAVFVHNPERLLELARI